MILGDSTVYCGLSPAAMEKMLPKGYYVLNAGTGSQQIWGSYYYLKDLAGKYDIDAVVLGIDQWAFTKQGESIKRDLLIIDRIKNPLIKLEFVRNVLKPEEYPYLLKSYANRSEWGNIPANLREKFNKGYWEKKLDVSGLEELNRGYFPNGAGMKAEQIGIGTLDEFSAETINPVSIDYLHQLVTFCKSEGIKLYMVCMPAVSTAVYSTDSYSVFTDFFTAYAKEKSVTFWDLNLMRDRMELIPDTDMTDTVHISALGAQKISKRLGQLIHDDLRGEWKDDIFFDTLENWKHSLSGIVGCDLYTKPVEGISDRRFYAESIQNEDIAVEYAFWVSNESETGEWILLQDYSESGDCMIPGKYLESDIWLKVCVREKGMDSGKKICCVRMRSPEMSD